MAFGSRSKLPAWLLGTMLSLANASAVADEFADVDPERLAKGVEILAAKWSIPAVVFQGATDDFAQPDKMVPLPSPKPMSVRAIDDRQLGRAYHPSIDILPEGFLYGVTPEEFLGAIKRRRN